MTAETQITGHISRRFDQELEDIRNQMLSMGGLVEAQVDNGLKCLIESDSSLARKVVKRDRKVNRLESEIDDSCVQILARRQPAAGDLRLVVAVIKTITDLERMGDQAAKLGKMQLQLEERGLSGSVYQKLEYLGSSVMNILHQSLDAFARMDVDDAMKTVALEGKVNAEFDSLMRELITHMMEDPRAIQSSLRISWSARALKRIGDHAINVCENVVYLVLGKDVRHLDDTEQSDL